MPKLTSLEAEVIEHCGDAPMLDQVVAWSAINSGSRNLDGLDRIAGILAEAFSPLPGRLDLTNPTPFRVGNYNAFDMQVGHSFSKSGNRRLKGLQVLLGVNNIQNRFPPLIPSEGNQSHDINAYDPIGRFVYMQAKYKF